MISLDLLLGQFHKSIFEKSYSYQWRRDTGETVHINGALGEDIASIKTVYGWLA